MPIPDLQDLPNLKQEILSAVPDAAATQITPENQPFPLPIQEGSGHIWRSIRVMLYAFAYSIGDEEDTDEPEFIAVAKRDSEMRAAHIPGVADPPEVEAHRVELYRHLPPVLRFGHLGDRNQHQIVVSCTAFDSDTDSAWERFVEALGQDLRDVGSTAIDGIMPGRLAPGQLLQFLTGHLQEFLVDSPEVIGGDQMILDRTCVWERAQNVTAWTGYKWVLFSRRNQPAYYLTLWRVDLSGLETELAYLTPSPGGEESAIRLASAQIGLAPRPMDAAALRVLEGEDAGSVASAMGVDRRMLNVAVTSALASKSQLDFSVRAGILSELASLRSKADFLAKSAGVTLPEQPVIKKAAPRKATSARATRRRKPTG